MKSQFENEYGRVIIGNDVIATYAGSVAVECFGIVGMAAVNVKDGIVRLLKKDYLTHGINVTVDENNDITIDFHVIISYGVSISTVTDNLIGTVKYRVEEFTGLHIKKINIFVEGVRVID
ncbi:MAG: Asp23/Gls24 family envelope stress response protein [Eubacterium sp.]|nr:Asp23/Gls24 family envelope stress response protein [Eubacterium sp.]MCI8918854.1 Asp23/Gls24 family envelope stress response protein [Eubacterium sp.]